MSGPVFRKVEFPELGEGRKLREPSAAAMFRIRKLRKKMDQGEDVETEQFATILASCLLDGAGKPVYASEDEAAKGLEEIPSRVLTALMQKFGELAKVDEGTPEGNSKGSPSGS